MSGSHRSSGTRKRSRSPSRSRSTSRDRRDKKSKEKRRHRSRSRSRSKDRSSRKPRSRSRSHGRSGAHHRSGGAEHRDRDRDRDREREKEKDSKGGGRASPERKTSQQSSGGGSGAGSSSAATQGPASSVAPPLNATLVANAGAATLSAEDQRAAEREAEQAALDEEIRRRRERVRAWQEARMKSSASSSAGGSDAGAPQQILHASLSQDSSSAINSSGSADLAGGAAMETDGIGAEGESGAGEGGAADAEPQKGWSLEDEGGEDDDGAAPDTATVPDNALEDVPLPPLVGSLPKTDSTSDLAGDAEVFSSIPVVTPRKANGPSSITVALTPGQPKPASSGGTPIKLTPTIKSPDLNRTVITSVKPVVNSRFSSKPAVSSAPEPSIAAAPAIDSRQNDEDDDYDPLEDFMSDLYGSGDVVEQKRDLPKPVKPISIVKPSTKMEVESAFGADADDENGSDDDDDSAPLNPYGSNFITLEEIMGGVVPGAGATASGRPKLPKLSSGWDSDSTAASPLHGDGNPQETEEEREEREERERQEFLQALRRAHEEEEKENATKDIAPTADDAKNSKEDGLGRVFASEGDVLDEYEVEEKKKSALELLEEQRKGKELKQVDHSQIEYIPFRKNLYIVPRQLARLDENEVKLRREALNIKVRGKGCPCPVETWEQCGLADRILGVIEKSNFKAPFAIQKQALPAIMCGRDVIGVAKTGSGKTLAFLLPMLRHIMDQPPLGEGEGPIGLIMAPARELAFQIFNEAKKFCKPLGLRVACIYGGAGIADQIAELKRGADIVVCTPGRMIDILTMQAGKMVSLKRVSMVVMDEADRMFDMGFEPQIRMIIQNIRPDRQTVLFSATFPKQIEKLAKSVLKFPLEIVIGERSVANKDITQFVELHDEGEKFLRLLQLLGIWNDRGSVLIFVDKQEKCDQLFQDLLKSGYPCLSLHGGKDQIDRDHTLHEFKSLLKTVMVATSVAGRGLDVPEIVCVINYNCPNHIEDYVHRIGRTGRAGRKGTAYTFISPNEEQYAPLMCKALEQAEQPVPIELQAMADRFKEKVNRGEAHWVGSGFVGKGFTFDASEMNETQKLASMQRRAYEIEQGIAPTDGKEEEEDADAFYDEKFGDLGAIEGEAGEAGSAAASDATTSSDSANPFEKARLLAASIAASTASSLSSIPPDASAETKAALARAKLIAMTMGTKGGAEDVAQHFSDEFDINDYPAQARRKVTNRLVLDEVTERTGVAIISRGSYIAPGKKLEAGERRLHLLIEASTEIQVKQARLEIQRLLDEETMRLGASMGAGGSFEGQADVIMSEEADITAEPVETAETTDAGDFDHERFIADFTAAADLKAVKAVVNKLEPSRFVHGRSMTLIRIIKCFKMHGLLPDAFPAAVSSMLKGNKMILNEAFNREVSEAVLAEVKSAACSGIGPPGAPPSVVRRKAKASPLLPTAEPGPQTTPSRAPAVAPSVENVAAPLTATAVASSVAPVVAPVAATDGEIVSDVPWTTPPPPPAARKARIDLMELGDLLSRHGDLLDADTRNRLKRKFMAEVRAKYDC